MVFQDVSMVFFLPIFIHFAYFIHGISGKKWNKTQDKQKPKPSKNPWGLFQFLEPRRHQSAVPIDFNNKWRPKFMEQGTHGTARPVQGPVFFFFLWSMIWIYMKLQWFNISNWNDTEMIWIIILNYYEFIAVADQSSGDFMIFRAFAKLWNQQIAFFPNMASCFMAFFSAGVWGSNTYSK